jgi:hypothetical protein
MRINTVSILCCVLGLAFTGVMASEARAAQGNIPLFTTQEDFTPVFSSTTGPPDELPRFTLAPVAAPDLDGAATNGLGNPSGQAGAPGTPGSLSVVWNSGAFNYIFSAGQQGNTALLNRLGQTGQIRFNYTQPPAGTGNYIDLGVVFNYENGFDQFFGSSTNLGNNVFSAQVNYTLSNPAPSYSYFQMGIIYNSNFNTNTPFYIDNIRLHVNPIVGDVNQDDVVDPADIQPMLAALTDLTAYQAAHQNLAEGNDLRTVLDTNFDGLITNSDIQALLNQLANAGLGSVAAVPEPATWISGVVAAICAGTLRRFRSKQVPGCE